MYVYSPFIDYEGIIVNIPVCDCYVYRNDLFSIELEDNNIIDSIGTFGIINPVIAREVAEDMYEIVVGRLRFKAIKYLGLGTIPAIIRNITDDEARIIMVETNLNQRRMDELKHSEIASIVYEYHSSLKAQGRRTDLIKEVCRIVDTISQESNLTFSPVGEKLNSAEEVGKKFKLSGRTISRYLRIFTLNDSIKLLVDEGDISIRAGVELSFLTNDNQDILSNLLHEIKRGIKYDEAILLREHERCNTFNAELIKSLLINKTNFCNNIVGFKPMFSLFKKYSLNAYNQDELENIIDKALYLYFETYSEKRNKVSWIS